MKLVGGAVVRIPVFIAIMPAGSLLIQSSRVPSKENGEWHLIRRNEPVSIDLIKHRLGNILVFETSRWYLGMQSPCRAGNR